MLVVCHSVEICFFSASVTLLPDGTVINPMPSNSLPTYLRVAVSDADGHDSAEHVEVPLTGMVKEPLHMSLVDQQWLPKMRFNARKEVAGADGQYLLVAGPDILFRHEVRPRQLRSRVSSNAAEEHRLTIARRVD